MRGQPRAVQLAGPREDQRRELFSAPGPELDESPQRIDVREDLASAAPEQVPLRSRNPIPRQLTDGLEERRAERVVQVAGRQLPRRQRQVIRDVTREGLN